MDLLLHLSNLHLRSPELSQDVVLDKLVDALGVERASSGADQAAVLITGDVFDSASVSIALARKAGGLVLVGRNEALLRKAQREVQGQGSTRSSP
jgi:hypothetical protein